MQTYVAFLRGINVGGRQVAMAELRQCFEDLGFTAVQTILQSGNVKFQTAQQASELKTIIEPALTERFTYQAKLQVLSLARLQQIITGYPFDTTDNQLHNYVVFVELAAEQALQAQPVNLNRDEQLAIAKDAIYWQVAKGQTLSSNFGKLLAKAAYRDYITTRNLRTLEKIMV